MNIDSSSGPLGAEDTGPFGIFFSSRRRHTSFSRDWSSDVCSSDLSVGEVMAIGRTFKESFQKALRGLEVGVDGLNQKTTDREKLQVELGEPGPERIW